MRHVVLVLLLAAFAAMFVMPGQLTAQWSDNPAVNTAMTTASSEQNYEVSTSDGAGGIITAWRDYRSGTNQDIYAQRINAAGVVQWINDVAICTAAGTQASPTIVSDGAGGAIITWEDNREGTNNDIYAQRVNSAGVLQWSPNGVAICTAVNNQNAPTIAGDGAGGAIIAWYDLRSGTNYDIYVQRVNAVGVVQWTSDGLQITAVAGNQQYPTILGDGAGGAIITWYDARSLTNDDIYAQKINAAGAGQWTAGGVVITGAAFNQQFPRIVSDGAGGSVITWWDYRSGTNWDIYAQRINAAGAVQWTTDGVAISTATNDQYSSMIAGDGAGGAIITWTDSRNGVDFDVYAQRISSAGTIQWRYNGNPISATANNQANPQIVGDGVGGAIIAWEDARSNPYRDIYAQKVNAAGAAQWTNGGIGISMSTEGKQIPTIVGDGAGGAIIAWVDMRAIFDIYAQKVTGNGLLGDGSVRILAVKDVKYDQGGRVNIFWNASPYDVYGDYNPISSYSIFRGVRPSSAGTNAIVCSSNQYLAMKKEGTLASNYYLESFSTEGVTDTIYWQWIEDVTARKLQNYVYAAPTLADSTPQGLPREYFMVTSNLYYYGSWLSVPDSGYSVDNLNPIPPTALSASIAGLTVRLSWPENTTDPDVRNYEIHRSTTSGFVPSDANRIGSADDTVFVDASPVAGTGYYRLVTVDIHGNRSGPSPVASTGSLTTRQLSVSSGWNLVSVPLTLNDYTKTVLFPTSTSGAFAYEGGYSTQSVLANGKGYWLKFSGGQNLNVTGYARTLDTITVDQGWNLVGSVSDQLQVSQITSVPGGIVTSQFYGYGGSYQVSTTIDPGRGYWVKVSQSGKLVLSSTGMEQASAIRIMPTDELPPSPPETSEEATIEVPKGYQLGQNYPNPFNPSTVIGYSLPAGGHVTLKVYNTLGNELLTLVDEEKPAGSFEVTFDASPARGGLASGVYYYRLTSGGFTATRKLMVLK
jgi:predicted lipoprotein with Yx(FWY)xxD motif